MLDAPPPTGTPYVGLPSPLPTLSTLRPMSREGFTAPVRPRRRSVRTGAVIALVLGGTSLAIAALGTQRPVAPAAAVDAEQVAPAAAVDSGQGVWAQVVERLDERRMDAVRSKRKGALAGVYASTRLAGEDRDYIGALVDRRLRLTGGDLDVIEAEPVRFSDRVARLRVVSQRDAYALVRGSNSVRRFAAGPSRSWNMTLVWSADRWRVSKLDEVKP